MSDDDRLDDVTYSAVTDTDALSVTIDTRRLDVLVVIATSGEVMVRSAVPKATLVYALRRVADSLESDEAVLMTDILHEAESFLADPPEGGDPS